MEFSSFAFLLLLAAALRVFYGKTAAVTAQTHSLHTSPVGQAFMTTWNHWLKHICGVKSFTFHFNQPLISLEKATRDSASGLCLQKRPTRKPLERREKVLLRNSHYGKTHATSVVSITYRDRHLAVEKESNSQIHAKSEAELSEAPKEWESLASTEDSETEEPMNPEIREEPANL